MLYLAFSLFSFFGPFVKLCHSSVPDTWSFDNRVGCHLISSNGMISAGQIFTSCLQKLNVIVMHMVIVSVCLSVCLSAALAREFPADKCSSLLQTCGICLVAVL